MTKIYKVQMNSKGAPDFSTAVEVADIPQGDVDAVAIFEREMHNLDQGYITIGEFDERIEPLRHLCYGRPQGEWIPCSERLPEDIRPVIVTWKNNDPESYYQYIVGKHFIGTAHYHRGKWYWYSSVTEDLLAEYGKCDSEEFDEAIEVVAWMPLPEPWKGADDE